MGVSTQSRSSSVVLTGWTTPSSAAKGHILHECPCQDRDTRIADAVVRQTQHLAATYFAGVLPPVPWCPCHRCDIHPNGVLAVPFCYPVRASASAWTPTSPVMLAPIRSVQSSLVALFRAWVKATTPGSSIFVLLKYSDRCLGFHSTKNAMNTALTLPRLFF